MMAKRLIPVLALTALAACAEQPTAVGRDAGAGLVASVGGPAAVPGRFIVTVADRLDPSQVAREHGVAPDFVYTHAINGFAGAMSEAARQGLLRDTRVTLVEPDGIAEAWTTETAASWGLDRIDQRALPLSGTYSYTGTGSNVHAYIIDTGIWTSHPDFEGRASVGVDEIGDGRNGIDCNGHGTHVAGTVGGATYGVAKGVTLVAVRVLNCGGSGTWSQVIAGVDWVTANHVSPAVANMSLGGGASRSVDNAVKAMIGAGVATAVAAGNGNAAGIGQDACKYSPSRVPAAMTIGATSSSDAKASWSNYGKCVDWFAPGVSITSDWLDGGTNTISGTSMATPHTTGVAALYLGAHPSATPSAVSAALAANATAGVVTSAGRGSPNLLLYTNY